MDSRKKVSIIRSLIGISCFFILLLNGCRQGPEKDKTKVQSIEQVHSEDLIIPGKSMGSFILENDIQPQIDSLGKPDYADAAMGKVLMKWDHIKDGAMFVFASRQMGVDEVSRIKIIRSLSPKFKTKENIRLGSSLSEIESHYNVKKVGEFKEGDTAYSLFLSDQHIGFEIDEKNVCHGIIIISPTYDSFQSYIPVYADFTEKD